MVAVCYTKIMKNTPNPLIKEGAVNWKLIGALTIIMPFAWFVLFFVWYGLYGIIFHPPEGDNSYSWTPLLVFLAVAWAGIAAVPAGIAMIASRRSVSEPAIILRRIASVLAIATAVTLLLFSVSISMTWGG